MKKTILAWLGALLLAAQGANADVSATVTALTDYDFRGVTLSSGDPALQASIDYTKGIFYASVWGSNLDYGDDYDSELEVDLIAGLTGETANGMGWDTGIVVYTYPLSSGSEPTEHQIDAYPEVYAGASFKIFDAKLWYSWDSSGSNQSAWYAEGNLNFSLPWELGLTLHGGYSFGDYWEPDGAPDASYSDFAITLSRSFGHFDFALKGVTTDTKSEYEIDSGAFANDSRLIFSVATTFPWSSGEE